MLRCACGWQFSEHAAGCKHYSTLWLKRIPRRIPASAVPTAAPCRGCAGSPTARQQPPQCRGPWCCKARNAVHLASESASAQHQTHAESMVHRCSYQGQVCVGDVEHHHSPVGSGSIDHFSQHYTVWPGQAVKGHTAAVAACGGRPESRPHAGKLWRQRTSLHGSR